MDHDLRDVIELCEHLLTSEQIQHIRSAMANYALAALMDPEIAEEAERICLGMM